MSDHHAAPDPVDKAYVQSEALLGDQDARAARRARVLDAVARKPAAAPSNPLAPRRPIPWRRGGWLAAASVAVFCAVLVSRVYPPVRDRLPAAAPEPAPSGFPATAAARLAPSAARPEASAHAPGPAAPRPRPARVRPSEPALRQAAIAPSPADVPVPAPALTPAPAPSPPQRLALAAAPMALPSARPRTSPFEEVVVAGSRISRRDFAGPSPALAARLNATPFVGQPFDQAASLRAAAAEGRTAELQTLLARGIPVDAPDPEGDTALMISIQAGRLEAVALLRRYGASLDQRNRAGLSARDMALAKGDPALDRAIGLEP